MAPKEQNPNPEKKYSEGEGLESLRFINRGVRQVYLSYSSVFYVKGNGIHLADLRVFLLR